jgi:hypothetical protein
MDFGNVLWPNASLRLGDSLTSENSLYTLVFGQCSDSGSHTRISV